MARVTSLLRKQDWSQGSYSLLLHIELVYYLLLVGLSLRGCILISRTLSFRGPYWIVVNLYVSSAWQSFLNFHNCLVLASQFVFWNPMTSLFRFIISLNVVRPKYVLYKSFKLRRFLNTSIKYTICLGPLATTSMSTRLNVSFSSGSDCWLLL